MESASHGPILANGPFTFGTYIPEFRAELSFDLEEVEDVNGPSLALIENCGQFCDFYVNDGEKYPPDVTWSLVPPSQVPTPATLALIGIGLAGLGWSRRKKL